MRQVRAILVAVPICLVVLASNLPQADAATSVTTKAATQVTGTSFTAHCAVNVDRQTRVYVTYGPKGQALSNSTPTNPKIFITSSTSDVAISVTGLTSTTAYDYKCNAYNSVDLTVSGARVSVTTSGAYLVETLAETGVTTSSFTARCSVSAPARAAIYLKWGPAGSGLPNKSALTYVIGNTTVSIAVNGLTGDTAYTYRCRLYNAAAGYLAAPTAEDVRTSGGPPPVTGPTVVAVGDMCDVTTGADESCNPTGRLAAALNPSAYLLLGDTQYNSGLASEYQAYYATSTWAPLNAQSYPAIGNHEINSGNDAGYCGYFVNANCPQHYYAFDIGSSWRAIVLDSNRPTDAAQLAWLDAELAASGSKNVLAYWHHPRWSNGSSGGTTAVDGFLTRLYAAHADVILSGHEHQYDRFAKMGATGPDAAGMRAFVVGTGGRGLYPERLPWKPGTETVIDDKFGVLELTLGVDDFSWAFHTTDGLTADSGVDEVTP